MKSNIYTDAVSNLLTGIKELTDSNMVFGNPIILKSGTTVIPVSKVTIGLISAKGEYGEIKIFQSNKNYPNTGGGGGIVSVKPCGFLIEKNKSIKYISCPQDYMDKTIETITSFLENNNEKT